MFRSFDNPFIRARKRWDRHRKKCPTCLKSQPCGIETRLYREMVRNRTVALPKSVPES